MAVPVQVVLVDLEIRHVLLGRPFKTTVHDAIEVAVQVALRHHVGLLLDLLVVVNDLVHVDVVLVVGVVMDDELARYRGHDVAQYRVHDAQQKVAVLLGERQVQAEVVLQPFGGEARLHVQAARGQAMYAQRIYDLHRHRLVGGLGEGTLDDVLKLSACLQHSAHGRVAAQHAVRLDDGPVVVERLDARCVGRHLLVEDAADAHRYVLQDVAILDEVRLVQHINVGRVDREHAHELLHARRHAAV